MSNVQLFGKLPNGEEVFLVKLVNKSEDLAVELISWGATIKSIYTKDKNGNVADLVLGQDTLEDYLEKAVCSGSFIGRFANRIGKAKFELNGKTYQLEANDKGNCLQGGSNDYSKRNFAVLESDESHVIFGLTDKGEGGFPGEVKASVEYRVTEENSLELIYTAAATQDTPINFTNHSYFNLGGNDSGLPLDHEIMIHADYFTKSDETCLPTGEILKVEGTPLDFREASRLGGKLDEVLNSEYSFYGFDHNYVLKKRGYGLAATAYDPASGRFMEVYTDQPGMQFYTANHLNGKIPCKGGYPYEQHCAYCFETQIFPDSVNKPHFPDCILKAGEQFVTTTKFKFSIKEE